MKDLLVEAVESIGRESSDVEPYVAQLEKEWDTAESLQGKTADDLGKYMPARLAEKAFELLNEN